MDTKKIGRFIATKRKEQKLTQMQLAEKLGITSKTISRWENGNYMPDISMLIPLCQILNIDVNDLLRGEDATQNDTADDTLMHYEALVKRNKKELLQNAALFSIIITAVVILIFISVVIFSKPGDYHLDRLEVLMEDLFKYIMWIVLLTGIIAMVEFSFAVYYVFREKKMLRLEGLTTGTVTGVLRSRLFKNDVYGDIPGGCIIGWGVAQGEQYWGGTIKFRVPPWFPCIKYEVDGVEQQKIMGEGAWKDTWVIGQKVTVLYKPGTPGICMIEGDPSYKNKMKLCVIVGILLTLICIIGILILMSMV